MKKFTRRDLPILRSMRATYKRMLEVLAEMRDEGWGKDASEMLALATVTHQVQDSYDYFGRELSRLEAKP